MNAKELAAKLDGIQYPVRISKELSAQAKESGLVIIYGSSDDLMEFEGAIYEEIGAWEGTTAYLTKNGLLQNECPDSDCPYFERTKEKAATIKALWCGEGEYSWTYETAIPHETFEVLEDGEPPYCRGIVFALADVVAA